MNCPVCNVTLKMTERQGVEIDYCERCRGVWLDRGELDKIIERATVGTSAPPQFQGGTQYNPPTTQHDSHRDSRHDDRGHYENQHQYKQHDDYKYKKKKKESFLSELFDF
jgi:uncharacterized protein